MIEGCYEFFFTSKASKPSLCGLMRNTSIRHFTSFNLKCILIHLYVSEYICWLSKYSWYIVLCRRLCLLNSYQTLIKNEAYQKYILYSLHLRNIMELFEEARVILVVQVHVYCLVITLYHTEATGKTRFTKCIVFLDGSLRMLQGKQVP